MSLRIGPARLHRDQAMALPIGEIIRERVLSCVIRRVQSKLNNCPRLCLSVADLDEWVSQGKQPPASVYPHLPIDLVRREHLVFPKIPGVDFPTYIPRTWRLNYGPDFLRRGIITIEPPQLGAAYSLLVPKVDKDGIDEGGIASPEIAVPLGTFTGWNYELPRLQSFYYLGGLRGSFIPFALTADERKTSGDSRNSILERYPSNEGHPSAGIDIWRPAFNSDVLDE